LQRFDVQKLLATATARTGLADFGPDDFLEGLTVLVDGINDEAKIRPDRWTFVHERLQRLLINRLWFAKDLSEHPEILVQNEGSPVIMASLPRTGSTKLHRMLASTGDFQTLTLWKAHMFARIPGLEDGGKARRIQETEDYEKWIYQTSPAILTGHPLFTHEAEEDQWLTECTFRHPLVFGMFDSMRYAQWLFAADMRPTFEYFLKQIRYLQWQSRLTRPKPWLLKTPNHLGNEASLTKNFNAPRFIVTHRDPVKCIPSITSTVMAMRRLYSDRDSSTAMGAGALQLFADAANTHMAWRDENPDVPVLDLSFDDINRNGIAVARKVYEFCGMDFSASAEAAILAWEADNPREKHGASSYSSAAIGTTDQDIREVYSKYIEHYAEYL
jgi:hypothetical protein